MNLDPALLDAIAQEVRQCFLEEDAPAYLEALQKGLQQFTQGRVDYTSLRRAAHSLKGGAGLAQLSSLSELAHKLEDLIEALHQQQVPDQQQALDLLRWGIEQTATLLSQARNQDCCVDPNLLQALEEFHQSVWVHGSTRLLIDEQSTTTSLATADVADAYLVKTALEVDFEDCLVRVEQLLLGETAQVILQGLSNLVEECTLIGETLALPWLVQAVVAIPNALEAYNNNTLQSQPDSSVETIAKEIIIRLRSLRSEYLQDQLLTPTALIQSPTVSESAYVRIPVTRLEYMANVVSELITSHERRNLQQQQMEQLSQRLQQLTSASLNDLHLQELLLQIQGAQASIELMNRELVEDQEQSRQNLDGLYAALLESRLVPFKKLAQRFLPQLHQLNQRYGKAAELVIEGEDVFIDQVILDELQTPLTHLLNNAFDHGIENSAERLALKKPEIAQIVLKATADENQVVITLKDDGRGIDLQKIYEQAVQQGCLDSMSDLSQEEILDFLFQPGFSTTPTVNALSGRGMGLDIVRTQINRLRGTVHIKTLIGQGTTFMIKLSPGLNLLSLLLCQQQRLVAIPTSSILEILPYSELAEISKTPPLVSWREQIIPVIPLLNLLPYPNLSVDSQPQVGIIVNGLDSALAITVDAAIGERQLILKPFDDTVIIPPYLAGCTILGTGEVVPVVLPYHFSSTTCKPYVASLGQEDWSHPQKNNRTVLVVEDSLATQCLLERLLTQEGYTVVICQDGQEALDELKQRNGNIDLVISDIEMPRLDGFGLLRQMRNFYCWDVPVVMLTSCTSNREQHKAMSLGASAYITKPVEPNELLSGISLLF